MAGKSIFEGTQWVSVTALRSRGGQGLGRSRRAVMTVKRIFGTLTKAWSLDVAGLSGVVLVNHARSASVISSIGKGFGQGESSVTGRLHFTSSQRTRWRSTSTVMCIVPAGSGRSLKMSFSFGVRVASISGILSYDSVAAITPSTLNMLTLGKVTFSVFATSSGYSRAIGSFNVKISSTSCASTIWNSMSSLSLKVFFLIGFHADLRLCIHNYD